MFKLTRRHTYKTMELKNAALSFLVLMAFVRPSGARSSLWCAGIRQRGMGSERERERNKERRGSERSIVSEKLNNASFFQGKLQHPRRSPSVPCWFSHPKTKKKSLHRKYSKAVCLFFMFWPGESLTPHHYWGATAPCALSSVGKDWKTTKTPLKQFARKPLHGQVQRQPFMRLRQGR